jgi:hypothetical protein
VGTSVMNILLEIFLWTGGGFYDYNIGRFSVKSGHSKFSCPECLYPGCLQRRMPRSFLIVSDSQFPGPRYVGRMRMGGGCYDYIIGRFSVSSGHPRVSHHQMLGSRMVTALEAQICFPRFSDSQFPGPRYLRQMGVGR